MPKKDMRQEMGKSPDRTDALALTFYFDDDNSSAIQTVSQNTSSYEDLYNAI